jgi:hypothetical protein
MHEHPGKSTSKKTRRKQLKQGREGKLTGYRLHDARLAWSGNGTAMRSIKYPLHGSDIDELTKKIRYDYRKLYGALQLSDLLEDPDALSIIEFWVTALAMGGIFASKTDRLTEVLAAVQGKLTVSLQLYDSIPDAKLRSELDPAKWSAFVLSQKRNTGQKPPQSFINAVATPAARTNPSAELQGIARKFTEQIALQPGPEAQMIFMCQLFGVSPPPMPQPKNKITFLFVPGWHEASAGTLTQRFTAVSDRLSQTLQKEGKVNKALLSEALGLDATFNGLSNFLGSTFTMLAVDSGEVATGQYLQDMKEFANYDDSEIATVREKIAILARMARQIGKPVMVNGWGDYRTDIGAKLSSFTSNRKRQEGEVIVRLEALSPDLDGLSELLTEPLPADLDADEYENLKTDAITLGRMTEGAIKAFPDVSGDDLESIQLLLSQIRPDVNRWWQAYQEEKIDVGELLEKKRQHVAEKFKNIVKDLPKMPVILGESSRQRLSRVINFKDDYGSQYKLLQDIATQLMRGVLQDATAVSAQDADRLRSWARNIRSDWGKTQATLLAKKLGVETLQLQNNEFFSTSRYARGNRKLISFTDQSLASFGATTFLDELLVWLSDPRQAVTNSEETTDRLELVKILCGLLAARAAGDIKLMPVTEKQQYFVEQIGDTASPAQANTYLQTLVLSDIRGLVMLASKQSFVERATIQATSGSQFALGYARSDSQPVTASRFYITHKGGTAEPPEAMLIYEKPGSGQRPAAPKLYKHKTNSGGVYRIGSSRYQQQFLWWLLEKPKRRTNELTFGGGFTIAEFPKKLTWDEQTKPLVESAGDPRLFVSIPFSILAESQEYAFEGSPKRILGIDVGEKGLAWVVAERSGDIKNERERIEVVASGFLRNRQHDKLAGEVKKLRERQTTGTFTSISTRVARLRASLVGSYRAELDSLALRYRARLSFERQISAFESGGNRIQKVYASLKKSEVWGQNDADQAVLNHYWGKDTNRKERRAGVEINAAGTSQTCSKCHRWFAKELNETGKYAVAAVSGSQTLGLAATPYGNIMVFAERGALPQTANYKELKSVAYAFMRPPIGSAALDYTLKHTDSRIEIGDPGIWKEQNANSAIFICPFEECLHISDADVQAALNIALRGFVRFDQSQKTAEENSTPIDYYASVQEQFAFDPIPLDPSKRATP